MEYRALLNLSIWSFRYGSQVVHIVETASSRAREKLMFIAPEWKSHYTMCNWRPIYTSNKIDGVDREELVKGD